MSKSKQSSEYGGTQPRLEQALAAKIFCSQAALKVAGDAVEMLGARGLAQGSLVEKLFRDARTASAEQGPNELLALTGARRLLG
jgi:alkylation response protein AidB-like acyl-CoA dehydrogenase